MAKKNVPDHPIIKALPNITLVIASLVTISNFVNKEFFVLNVWVVLSFLLACWLYSLYFAKTQKSITKGAQQKKRRLWLTYLPVIGIPILMIAISFYRFKGEQKCIDPGMTLTIGVANFEESNQSQDFSTELLSSLKEKIRSKKEELLVKHISLFFDLKEQDNVIFKKLEESARLNCINQGLVIYGRWVEKQNYPLYHGYFFIQDREAYRQAVRSHPRLILDSLHHKDIKMPQEFKFEMPKYADSLANLALAIMKFYGGSYAEARKLLQHRNVAYQQPVFQMTQQRRYPTLQRRADLEKNGLKAVAEFYLATIDVIEGNINSAKARYQRSYHLDGGNYAAIANYEYLNRMTAKYDAEKKRSDSLQRAKNNEDSRRSTPHRHKPSPALAKKDVKKNTTTITAPVVSKNSPPIEKAIPDSLLTVEHNTTVKENGNERRDAGEKTIVAMTTKVRLVDEFSSATYESKTFEEVTIFTEKGKFGIWDKNHQVLTDRLYDKIIAPGREGFLRVVGDGKVGFITAKGKPLTALKYDGGHDFQEDMAAVRLNGKWGFIDSKGVEVIPCQYEIVISDFMRETAVVSHGGKTAIRINKRGAKVRNERLK